MNHTNPLKVIIMPQHNKTHHDDVIKWRLFLRVTGFFFFFLGGGGGGGGGWRWRCEVTGHPLKSPHKRLVTRSFHVFFDLHLNQQLSKQWRRQWFYMPSRSLWGHCNDNIRCSHLWNIPYVMIRWITSAHVQTHGITHYVCDWCNKLTSADFEMNVQSRAALPGNRINARIHTKYVFCAKVKLYRWSD